MTSPKKRILFIGEGVTLSHIIRPVFLAQSLDKENYEIVFACDKRYRALIENAGFPWVELPSMSTEEFNKRLSTGEPVYTHDRLEQYLLDERELFEKTKPNLIVGDFRISLGISSRLAKIPYVCLINAYWSPFSKRNESPFPELPIAKALGPQLGEILFRIFSPIGFSLHYRDFNKICRQYGLETVKTIQEMYSQGTWTLYPDVPQIAPSENLPNTHKYLGPICELPNMVHPEWWGKWPENKPLIYLSLGSSGNISILTLIKDVLKKMEVTVIFTTSGRASSANMPENFFVTDYVSGLEVAKVAQLFITNGGSGSVYQGLSDGVPVLGFPTNMDQFFVMEQIVELGAGKLIRPSLATKNTVSAAIHELLAENKYRQSAQNLSQQIVQFDPGEIFKNFLNDVLVNS
jgi:UDP:flavonoid glycosyltransferase YjiC (YdhE family)